MHLVVALLAPELGDEVGERGPGAAGERLESDGVCGLVQVAPRDGHRPVAPAVVEQAGVAVLVGLAVVGDGIGVTGRSISREQPVQRGGVAELVLRQRAHRHVLFEERRDARSTRNR